MVQAEADADVDIAKAAVTMSAYKSTTLIGEDTDLLMFLLYHVVVTNCSEIYLFSDKKNIYQGS